MAKAECQDFFAAVMILILNTSRCTTYQICVDKHIIFTAIHEQPTPHCSDSDEKEQAIAKLMEEKKKKKKVLQKLRK